MNLKHTENLMLSKRYKSTEVDRRTWLHVPSETHWSTSILFIYLFNTLFQEGDEISYKLFLLAVLIIITTTICTIYTKSHSHEYRNKIRNSQYMTTTNLWCVLTLYV